MTDEEIQSIYDATVIPPYEHAQWLEFARAIAAAEREECGQIVDPGNLSAWETRGGEEGLELMRDLAAAIRARGEK